MRDTRPLLLNTDFPLLHRGELATLQVNLGYLCNLSCTHCHVNAGPKRTELMDMNTIDLVLKVMAQREIRTLDLTGGAPEMNPHFRYLVTAARKLGVEVIDRCNLTILEEPGYEDLATFLAQYHVTVVASLPCYSAKNVAAQRGKGVFERSIDALKRLNDLGYGKDCDKDNTPGLQLDLVYNPNGAFLPPEQGQLEAEYKKRLSADFGIEFNQLYAITNMPISRFGALLLAKGEYNNYMTLLKQNFSAANLDTLMCLNTLSVDWQGYLYDCDFNQMLKLNLPNVQTCSVDTDGSLSNAIIGSDSRRHLRDLLAVDLTGNSIITGDHCYGCTAGQGSSCGGALEKN